MMASGFEGVCPGYEAMMALYSDSERASTSGMEILCSLHLSNLVAITLARNNAMAIITG